MKQEKRKQDNQPKKKFEFYFMLIHGEKHYD